MEVATSPSSKKKPGISSGLLINRDTLLKPLQLIAGVIERKQTLPILANVLLETTENELTVTATDLEAEIIGKAELEQTSSKRSRITVPGRKLIDICKALPEGAPIELRSDGKQVSIHSGKSRFALSTLSADEFPCVQLKTSSLETQIDTAELKELLHKTAFAMAQQDVRYYLNGILLEISSKQLRAVATDGHRLALKDLPCTAELEQKIQVIVPRKGVAELSRLLNSASEQVTLLISGNHIRIASKQFVFTSKLIDGRFPDYKRVIPSPSKNSFEIDSLEFKQALMRAAILCNDKFRGVKFELSTNRLKITSQNPEHESAEEELNINYQGDPLTIGFNVTYCLDILNATSSPTVRFSCVSNDKSALIEETDNNSTVYVIMPMTL